MGRHTDRRVLITGAANGIGLAAARFFAAEGAVLSLVDLPEKDLKSRADELSRSTRVLYRETSVTDEEGIKAAIDQMVATFGGLDAVVNSAGVVLVESVLKQTTEQFRQVVDINLTGTWIVCQAAAHQMADQGSGSIVNISSVYGFQGAPGRTAYCASKGAVIALTNSLAVELGPLGIRVNSVAPTGTRTPMVQDLIDRGIYNLDAVRRKTPLGRLAEPEEVAAACAFLASDEARMINGHHLQVDGGWLANGFPT